MILRAPRRERRELVPRLRAPRRLSQSGEWALHHALLALVVICGLLVMVGWGVRNVAIAHASGQEGTDISIWQGYPACGYWNGQQLGMAKAAGADAGEYTDPTFAHNANCLRSHGIYRGSYYFASPPAPDPGDGYAVERSWGAQQASDYLNRLNATGIGLHAGESAMLDIETGNGDQSTFAASFLDTFYSKTGLRALIYASLGYINGHLYGRGPGFAAYPLDEADWYYGLPPAAPWPWTHLTVWQWGDSGYFNGIGPVDQDELVAGSWPGLAVSAPPPAPAPPPTPGCSFGASGWTSNPWPNGDGNQQMTVYKYGGSVSCPNPQFAYGLQYRNSSGAWANVGWDPWTTRTSDFWALSFYATPCNRPFRFMVAIRSGTGKIAAYRQVASWIINRDCA